MHNNLHIQTLVNFILHSFKLELWKQRNVVKFENKRVSSETIVNSLRQKVIASGCLLENSSLKESNDWLIENLKKKIKILLDPHIIIYYR